MQNKSNFTYLLTAHYTAKNQIHFDHPGFNFFIDHTKTKKNQTNSEPQRLISELQVFV